MANTAKEQEFVENVVAMLAAEHGLDPFGKNFETVKPYLRAAFATEGTIPNGELEDLCMGEENEERRELEEKYPKLTRIFESIFDGVEPFELPTGKTLWFYVPDYTAVREKLQVAYTNHGVFEHAAEPGRVGGCPNDADVHVQGDGPFVDSFAEWLRGSGIPGLMIEGQTV